MTKKSNKHIILIEISCDVFGTCKHKRDIRTSMTCTYKFSDILECYLYDASEIKNWIDNCKQEACKKWLNEHSDSDSEYQYFDPKCNYIEYDKIQVIK